MDLPFERRRTVNRVATAVGPDREGRGDHQRRSSKVTFLVGHGATGATDEVLLAAQLAGAGIITALRGKQVVPSDIPYHSQQLGLLGSLPSANQMEDCDTLVLLGTNYPYGQFLPKTGQARAVQVDLRPSSWACATPPR